MGISGFRQQDVPIGSTVARTQVPSWQMRRSMDYPYYYAWGNNSKRVTLKDRPCRVVARGKMNSVLIEFENGQREVVSRYAIRKVNR